MICQELCPLLLFWLNIIVVHENIHLLSHQYTHVLLPRAKDEVIMLLLIDRKLHAHIWGQRSATLTLHYLKIFLETIPSFHIPYNSLYTSLTAFQGHMTWLRRVAFFRILLVCNVAFSTETEMHRNVGRLKKWSETTFSGLGLIAVLFRCLFAGAEESDKIRQIDRRLGKDSNQASSDYE
jgi:hypothetical protein